jgi:5-(carboxyamino)imidazole ribonucleotide mutase
MTIKIGIIMGSDSDLEVMQDAAIVCDELGIGYELTIVSAHRTPDRLVKYAKEAAGRGIDVVIAGAGGAAHLPGMIASLTHLPVIGVPVKSSSLNGEDSLLSIVQMPPGVPVATVAINGSRNAGILAAQILGISDPVVAQRVINLKKSMGQKVLEKAEKLETMGFRGYLNES